MLYYYRLRKHTILVILLVLLGARSIWLYVQSVNSRRQELATQAPEEAEADVGDGRPNTPLFLIRDIGGGWHELEALTYGFKLRFPDPFEFDERGGGINPEGKFYDTAAFVQGNTGSLVLVIAELDKDLRQIAVSRTDWVPENKRMSGLEKIEINDIHGYRFEYVSATTRTQKIYSTEYFLDIGKQHLLEFIHFDSDPNTIESEETIINSLQLL